MTDPPWGQIMRAPTPEPRRQVRHEQKTTAEEEAKSEEQPGLYETKAGRKRTRKKNHHEEDDVRTVRSRRLSSCR
ncbi:hypothetical protein [Paraburkholderia sp. 35.1]|uniref:hypothetical protein n=1 Tax=Paraburkholderia sp. 35.1 TaxID=2991058 RepID=UPI003D1ED567